MVLLVTAAVEVVYMVFLVTAFLKFLQGLELTPDGDDPPNLMSTQ